MTEKQAREKAVQLENHYRMLLNSADRFGSVDAIVAGIQRKFAAYDQEFAVLLKEHPQLFRHLEERYRLACNGTLKTKSRWPKKGATRNASDLMAFAHEEDLDLFGEPKAFLYSPSGARRVLRRIRAASFLGYPTTRPRTFAHWLQSMSPSSKSRSHDARSAVTRAQRLSSVLISTKGRLGTATPEQYIIRP